MPKSFVLLQGRQRIVSAALMLYTALLHGREHNVFFMPAAGAAQKFGGLRAVPDALAAGEILKRIRAIDLYRSRRERFAPVLRSLWTLSPLICPMVHRYSYCAFSCVEANLVSLKLRAQFIAQF